MNCPVEIKSAETTALLSDHKNKHFGSASINKRVRLLKPLKTKIFLCKGERFMNVQIYSRKDIEALIGSGHFPQNAAAVSFCDRGSEPCDRVDYSGVCGRVMYIELDDLDLEELSESGFTYDTFFPEADEAAEFIIAVYNSGMDIICQCEYGQSRSAGCAAAVMEHFYHTGISLFADYRYYPNKVVYHKIFDALKAYKERFPNWMTLR